MTISISSLEGNGIGKGISGAEEIFPVVGLWGKRSHFPVPIYIGLAFHLRTPGIRFQGGIEEGNAIR